jgi:hypothetical protein
VVAQDSQNNIDLEDRAPLEVAQETQALLRLLTLGEADIASQRLRPIGEVVVRLKTRYAANGT